MGDKKPKSQAQIDRIDRVMRYANLIEKQAGKAVRPFRADGYVNLLNRYGTSKDTSEHYQFAPEPAVPDDVLSMFYEGNGLFSKIIDTPAEEAVKHGFSLADVTDQTVLDFCYSALDELDWEETAMTAIKWARLFGGSIAVMLINDGRGIDEPLDWSNIQSIDDIRIYDRSLITPDYSSMFSYDPQDPFRTRGSRLGMPEYYTVFSRYGNFTVHDSRCLVFQNGVLPENCTNSVYQLWGMPEYVRIHRAIRDAELAHASGPKMLDKSVQAIYKMKNLAMELATEEGEDRVLKRLQVIDMARGMLNSIAIDAEGEDYDFKSFQLAGVADVIDAACNYLSALTSIPQTILFGRSPAGMNATGESDMENFYNYVERIQKRMLRGNLRYLLSVVFQAGVSTGEIGEVPKINVNFNPLWSMSDNEQADLEQKKAQTQQTKAQTAQLYVDMGAIDPTEVRKKLADSQEFDVENMLDGTEDDEDLFAEMAEQIKAAEAENEEPSETVTENGVVAEGNSPDSAPAATKLPQDMTEEELAEAEQSPENADNADDIHLPPDEGKPFSVGVIVVSDGRILTGKRHNDFGYGLICGPGGHGEKGETPEQAAFRETEEEFEISPKELIPLGVGPAESDTGLQPYIFLCQDYEGEISCVDLEMTAPTFRSLEELELLSPSLFQPFADSLTLLKEILCGVEPPEDNNQVDGGPGSGNHNHKGVEGQIGGSAKNGGKNNLKGKSVDEARKELSKCGKGSKLKIKMYDENSGRELTNTLELDEDGFWVSPNGDLGFTEEDMAYTIASSDTVEASLDVKATGDRVKPEGFEDRMGLYVGGGYGPTEILESDDVEFIKMNSQPIDKPMYRVEESRFTAADLADVGQEFSFQGDIRSFTRSSKVTNSMLDENSDEYAYVEEPVVFKTVGTTMQFDVTPYAAAYKTAQEESFVGGRFKVVSKSTYVTPQGEELPMIEIEQIGGASNGDSIGSGNSVQNADVFASCMC